MHLLDRHLNALIDEPYRQRGKQYVVQGLVELISITESSVSAKCVGTRVYVIHQKLSGEKLSGTCTCPAFADFGPCKHMAGVGYAVIAKRQTKYVPSENYAARLKESERFDRFLMKKSKAELILIIKNAAYDDQYLLALIDDELEG